MIFLMKTIACNCEKQTWHVIKKVLCSKHKKLVLCQPHATNSWSISSASITFWLVDQSSPNFVRPMGDEM